MSTQLVVLLSLASIASTTPLLSKNESKPLSNSVVQTSNGSSTANTITVSPNSVSTSTSSNKERNWLLTKAWLIDNINRLRHEFIELERDYNHHIDTAKSMDNEQDKKMVQDMSTLRADHIVLSQQQKQIIELIKKSQYNAAQPTGKQQWLSTASPNSILIKKKHKKRDSHLKNMVQTFEEQTKRNMSEVFAEMSALHDITISIFEDLMDLQKKFNQNS